MNLADLQPPPPGSWAAHLVLDRQAPDIADEIARLLEADPPEATVGILAGWWYGSDRWLAIGEGDDWILATVGDDPEELEAVVLGSLMRTAESRWSVVTAADLADRVMALLLRCSHHEGGMQ